MTVKQIENAIALLEYFAERQAPATLADIVRDFGWPRSSAFNILTTLVENGYLYEPTARGGFYPSSRWMQLAHAFAEGEPVPEPLHAIIADLSATTGETVWVSAPSGLYALFLDVIESSAAVRYAAKPGKRVPIHITASGQALLSQMPARDRDVLLRKASFGNWGANAPRDLEALEQEMQAGRARGWFRSASNYSPDLGGVAVPVILRDRIFSVTVAGPLFRVAEKAEAHAMAIHAAIARELGADYSTRTLRDITLPPVS
ncbi:IclR family transcriptional regulator [Phaeovulum sp. W22_SRMD_FR3]|uniref:IclR family transcriptional regulator n=1 Tax=Phaeovulum sp. W22_SRMD_FR3 TaxID=3240274 RepID=UPI003F94A27A